MNRTKLILLCAGAAALAPSLAWSRVTPPPPPEPPRSSSSGKTDAIEDLAAGNSGANSSRASDAQSAAAIRAFLAQLHPQHGDIRIPEANAVLHLGQQYYFLPAAEARRVLSEAWGNPPSEGTGVLGMVLPEGKTVADPDTWAAVITWEASGYVSDDDAGSADYDAVLQSLRDLEPQANAQRRAQGYQAIHLVGWAEPPSYDSATHSVIWARNLQVEGMPQNTLN